MSKLDWMYKSSNTVDPEEYLLGRSIDNSCEKQGSSHNEVDKDILPTSIFAGANSNVQVDVFRKKKEDPLEQIKQKEIEMRKQLLKNPVKLKKLQNMLKAKEDKKIHKDKKKKKKKSKDEDIDDLLAAKYMKLISKYGAKNLVELTKSDDDSEEEDSKVKKKKKQKLRSRSRSPSLSLSSDEEQISRKGNSSSLRNDSSEQRERSKKKSKRSRSRSGGNGRGASRRRSRSRGSDRGDREKLRGQRDRRSRSPYSAGHDRPPRPARARGNQTVRKRIGPRQRSTSGSSDESAESRNEPDHLLEQRSAGKVGYDYSSDEGKSKLKKAFGLVLPKGVEPRPASRPQPSDSRGDTKSSESKSTKKYVRSKPTKLTEEEKQAKLKEMMENAQKWEKTRKTKVSKYREEQKKEDAQEKTFDGEFMRKELAKATSKTVAERIKSNINNVQRSKFSMDQHFAKRT